MSKLGIYDETTDKIFFEGDLVVVTIKPHVIRVTAPTIYLGRIYKIPGDQSIVLDISEKYHSRSIVLENDQIVKIEKLEETKC